MAKPIPLSGGRKILPTREDLERLPASFFGFGKRRAPSPPAVTYSVSGTIVDDGAQSLYGVTVQLKQGATIIASTSTNEEGAYSFTGVSPGTYRILPTLAAYTMAPTHLDVTVVDANLTEKNFVGTEITFEVSGQILDSAGSGLDGVTVTIPAIAPVVTAGGGLYSFELVPGNYTLTPTLAGSTFLPTSRDVEVVDDDVDVADMQQVWGISGVIEDSDEVGFEDVTVTLSGDASDSTTTAGDGSYSFSGLVDGSYTVTPTKVGSVFSADHEDVVLSGDDVVVDTMIQVQRIYGVVVDGADNPIENVLMTMSGDVEDTTTTNASGEWEFYIINREVTITPSLAGYSFAPADQDFDVQGADEEAADFVAVAASDAWISAGAGDAQLSRTTTFAVDQGANAVALIGFWVYFNEVPAGNINLMEMWYSVSTIRYKIWWEHSIQAFKVDAAKNGGGTIHEYAPKALLPAEVVDVGTGRPKAQTWMHLMFQISGGTSSLFWVNGVSQGQMSSPEYPLQGSVDCKFRCGAARNVGSGLTAGSGICQLRMHKGWTDRAAYLAHDPGIWRYAINAANEPELWLGWPLSANGNEAVAGTANLTLNTGAFTVEAGPILLG